MTNIGSDEVSLAILEMRDLLRLLAEPAVAERDKKYREALKTLAGTSKPKAKAISLMDGSRTQKTIHVESGINQGHLSTLVKQLLNAKLLSDDKALPKLIISIPANFFEKEN